MFDSKVGEAVRLLSEALDALDPQVLDPQVAISLTEQFCRLERMCAAGKALCAGRASDSGAWITVETRSPAHWVAGESRCTVGHAVNVLETAERIKDLEEACSAFKRGELSERQAHELAVAAQADPQSERELLEAAEHLSFHRFQQRCRAVKAAATPAEQRHRQIHAKRYLRHWSDVEGAFCLEGRLTAEAGAQVLGALEPFRLKIVERARRQRREEIRRRKSLVGRGGSSPSSDRRISRRTRTPEQAILADALVEMASGAVSPREDCFGSPKAMVHVRVDHAALVRGDTTKGEICEVPGVGPISVAAARALASDAYISALVVKGADVQAVAKLGRSIPSAVRRALVERDPACVVPGCQDRGPLEIDHIRPLAQGGETKLSNLARLCHHHHYLKTFHGWRLEGGPGRWRWIPPGGPPFDELDVQPQLCAVG